MNDSKNLLEFTTFLNQAITSTYFGAGAKDPKPQRSGFTEYSFRSKEGLWAYKDSYTGFYHSWGQEVVWYENKPFWSHLYGGGMNNEYYGNEKFASETFKFLIQAISNKVKDTFTPRGPRKFVLDKWIYLCDWSRDVANFKGDESISLDGKEVFTHHFFGGLVVDK